MKKGLRVAIPRLRILGACVLLGLIPAGVWAAQGGIGFTDNSGMSSKDKTSVNASTDNIYRNYLASQNHKVPPIGSTFPAISFPSVSGFAPLPNMRQSTVLVTLGGEYAVNIKALYRRLSGKGLRFVHIVYPNTLDNFTATRHAVDMPALYEFDPSVSVVDLKSNATAKSQAFLKSLGAQESGYAFLVKNGTVVYRNNAVGLNPEQVERDILSALKSNRPVASDLLNPRESVRLDALVGLLPKEKLEQLKAFVYSGRVGMVFMDASCSMCNPSADYVTQFKSKWESQKKKVVYVYSGETENKMLVRPFSIELSLKKAEGQRLGSVLSNRLNVRGFPEILVIKEGKLEGRIPFLEIVTPDGKTYQHMYFSVLDKIFN